MNTVNRLNIYLFTYIFLTIFYFIISKLHMERSINLHTHIETFGSILSFFVGVIALTRFYSKKNNTFLLLSTGYIGTALLQGIHGILTSTSFIKHIDKLPSITTWCYLTSRIFLPILLLLSYFSWQKENKLWDRGKLKNYYIYLIAFIMIITSLIFSIFSPHSFFLKDHFILGNIEKTTLPFDILNNSPTFLYFFLILGYIQKGEWKNKNFDHWLILSFIFSFKAELILLFSDEIIDLAVSHILKNLSYFIVLIGLIQNMHQLFSQAEISKSQITIMYKKLRREMIERKRIERELRNSKERYRLLIEHSPDMIAVSTDGVWSYVNTTGRQLLGAIGKEKEIIGRSIYDFIHPDEHQIVAKKMKQVMTEKPCVDYLERRFISLDGRVIYVEVLAIPIQYEGKSSIQIVARDIFERKRAEEMIRKSEKLSAISQLAAGIAHEIRNPLTSLKGFTQILQSGATEKEEYYQIMLSELKRIETIISELLMLAKPQEIQLQKKSVEELLQHVITLLGSEAIMANVEIVTDFESDLPMIRCEENQLKQVFINLLKNAIEAMPDGGKIMIKLNRVENTNEILVSFIDEGQGIPEQLLSKLGEPFYTTKEKGTGLGLMVSHRIIKNHQGRMEFKSKQGLGTMVHIFLPAFSNEN
ncbi:sporulation kinase A [Tepidibacillus sp. HK-1]|nr:sporulation kinase A [Tepidibacillus sp. HK-1]